MTIGPAPMMRMLFRSLRFGIAHQRGKAVEQITDIVRPGASFGMALEAEGWAIGSCDPLKGTVEERDVRRPQVGAQGCRVDGEAMVLAGNPHLAGIQILHRVVGAVVPELHLKGLRARSEAHELVTEADAEDR